LEKGNIVKMSTESEKVVGNRGEIWNRGNASLPQRGWTPLYGIPTQ